MFMSYLRETEYVMSYLKIFPRSICVQRDGMDEYVGRINYDFEQYGCMSCGCYADLLLSRHSVTGSNWFISSLESHERIIGFAAFMHALNYYLFDFLKFDPLTQWCKPFDSQFEYNFEPVYFDMDQRVFISNINSVKVKGDVRS